ncbi:MAG: hypothetical protein OER93_07875, partial [Thermoleophilia bacterium]|nr:hypothetical protein [Thermoleophilia bacterium]
LLGAALPYPVFADTPRIAGVADERRFYPAAALEKRRRQGEVVGRALAGTGVRLMFEGGMCAFGYYSRLPYLVELTGLTQYSLAKLPLGARGWIGHEKHATVQWMTENDIHLVLSHAFPPVTRPSSPPADHVYFGDAAVARIVRYDDALMQHLAGVEDVRFTPIEVVVERKRRQIDGASRQRAEEHYASLDRYYLAGAGDAGREIARDLRARIDAKP